jgi:hypothetical protein
MKEAEMISDIRFLLNQLMIQERWQDRVAIDLIQKKYNTDFDIESLDPDERSWYYDGHGVKRKKESG